MKHKKLIRIFFNTYNEDKARQVLEKLREKGDIKVSRSGVVKELYYVELYPASDRNSYKELVSEIEEFLKAQDGVFGVKTYYVET